MAYNYYPDKPQAIKCGEDWMWQDRGSWATLKTGQWHRLRIYMKVNTFSAFSVAPAFLSSGLVHDETNALECVLPPLSSMLIKEQSLQ